MGQDFQLKSLDGINWQPFPDVKPIGKKSNKVYKQKKKTKHTRHPNFVTNFPFEPNDIHSTKT